MSVLFPPSSQITVYFEINACLLSARKLFKCIDNDRRIIMTLDTEFQIDN